MVVEARGQCKRDHRSISAIICWVCFRFSGAAETKAIRERCMRRILSVSAIARLIKTIIIRASSQNAISILLMRPIPIDGVRGRLNCVCRGCAYSRDKSNHEAYCASHGSNVDVNIAAACSCPCLMI